jgi:hypothetical protein
MHIYRHKVPVIMEMLHGPGARGARSGASARGARGAGRAPGALGVVDEPDSA